MMISLEFDTPAEVAKAIAQRSKARRLSMNLSQKTLSERSAVSASVIKQFEHTGKISFESLLKIAFVLSALGDFKAVFINDPLRGVITLDDLLKEPAVRKRGRE